MFVACKSYDDEQYSAVLHAPRLAIKAAYYSADTDYDEMKKQVKDVDREWTQYDLVMYTQCIKIGVKFNVQGHVDRAYAWLTAPVSGMRDRLSIPAQVPAME